MQVPFNRDFSIDKQVPTGNNTVVNSLAASKYMFEENALDNGEVNEENKCFCRFGKWYKITLLNCIY